MKLNLGCGQRKLKGYVNIDKDKNMQPDVVCDANALPFKRDSFDLIYSCCFVEHISNIIGLMEEIWRVSRDSAMLDFIYPHANYLSGAVSDITHVRLMTEHAFDSFIKFRKKEIRLKRTIYGKIFPEKITLFLSNFIGFMIIGVRIKLETIKV